MSRAHIPSKPPWGEAPRKTSSPLPAHTRTDVCIVGAGIAGMSTAYLLTREGKFVTVLDDGPVGGGQTGRTTAHLASVLDDRYSELEKARGLEAVRLAIDSHSAAIDAIENIVQSEKIDCDFERLDGYLFNGPGSDEDILTREWETLQRAGFTGMERLRRAPITSFDTGPCLRFPRQGQFHPLKYLHGLLEAIQRRRGLVYSDAHVERIEGGAPAQVTVAGGPVVIADAVVTATNIPVNDLLAIHTKQAAYLTYAIAARVPRKSVARGLYWDTLNPYHYVRLQSLPDSADHELLIVGGEDHKTGQADDGEERFRRLEAWARERFPMIEDVVHRWSGQILETIDGLAFIGRNPFDAPNILVATGDSGMGMTHGTIAGMLITDLLFGRDNEWEDLYDPSRRPLRGILGFAGETLNMAAQYKDWLTGSDVGSVAEIRSGEGAIMRSGLGKVAVYRDEGGRLHEFSATCPHLGCIVHWNQSEKTWDCPCHGSRFACDGRVINGPANRALTPVATEKLAVR